MTKYWTLTCHLVQVPRVAVTAVAVPKFLFQLWPTFDVHSFCQRKLFFTLISGQ